MQLGCWQRCRCHLQIWCHTRGVLGNGLFRCSHRLTRPLVQLPPLTALQMDGQDEDVGVQYRSGIYYHTDEQKEVGVGRGERVRQRMPVDAGTLLRDLAVNSRPGPPTPAWPALVLLQMLLG